MANPNRHTVDLDLDHSRTGINRAPWHSALTADRQEDGATSRIAGTNWSSLVRESAVWDACNSRRQPTNCCGESPCHRATAEAESPLAMISATIRALSSALHVRRRPAPVNTSSRRTGLVIALSTVSILSLTVYRNHQTRRSGHHQEGDLGTPLTILSPRGRLIDERSSDEGTACHRC